MIIGRPIAKLLDFITGIVAFVTVGIVAFFYINAQFGFISGDSLTALTRTKDIMLLVVLGLAGLEFALRRNVLLFLLFLGVAALAVVFIFISGVFA